MENKFDKMLIEKARQAKSPEELTAIAKENGIDLTQNEAEGYFEQLNMSGELSDEELDSVSGGGCSGWKLCPRCEQPLFNDDGHWYCRSCSYGRKQL